MFLNHFQMALPPFGEKPLVEWLLQDSRFQEALSRLTFFQYQGHIALVLGQTGVGNFPFCDALPAVCRWTAARASILRWHPSAPMPLLRQIVTLIGDAPRIGKYGLFHLILERVRKSDSEIFLILDEAHLISSRSQTDLRLLSSSGIDTQLPLKIILCAWESFAILASMSLT
jgi:general secretion pathway protein A